MMEWMGLVGASFAALFVVVEPFGLVPLFVALTHGRSRVAVTRIARRATRVGGVVLIGCSFSR